MKSLYGIIALALLAGCAKNNEPLSGKRESVIVSNLGLEVSKHAGTLVLQPSAGNPFVGTTAFSTTPTLLWKYKFYDLNLNGNIMAASPVLAGGKVFILDAGGIVHCLDSKSGKLLWKAYTTVIGETGQSGGAIAYAQNNTLLVSTAFGEVFFINANTGKVNARIKLPSPCKGEGILVDGSRAYFNCIANDVCAVDLNSRKIAWSYKEIEREDGYVGMAQPVSYKNTLITASSSGELICLDKSTGKEIWKILLSNYSVTDATSTIAHLRTTPVICDNTIYVNSPSGMVYAVNASSGDIIWSRNIGSLTPVNITGDHLFVVNENAELACINRKNGNVLSLQKIEMPLCKKQPFFGWFSSDNNKRIIFQFLTDKGILHVISDGMLNYSDYNNNREITKYDVKHPISIRPLMVNNELYILSDDGFLMKYGAHDNACVKK